MSRGFSSSFRGVIAVAVIVMFAGNAFAVPREGWAQGRGRGREYSIVKMVKKIVRALGDGPIVPLP